MLALSAKSVQSGGKQTIKPLYSYMSSKGPQDALTSWLAALEMQLDVPGGQLASTSSIGCSEAAVG